MKLYLCVLKHDDMLVIILVKMKDCVNSVTVTKLEMKYIFCFILIIIVIYENHSIQR